MPRKRSWPLLALCACACPGPAEPELGAETGTAETTEEAGADTQDASCESPVTLPDALPPALDWTTLGEVEIDDQGLSSSITIPVDANARYLALRTVPLDGTEADNIQLCHALLEATLADDSSLIPLAEDDPLLDTHQRSYPGPSAGVFVFSSALAPLVGPDEIELRIQLRNCVTGTSASRLFFEGMPTRVGVEIAQAPAPDPDGGARLGVRMLVAEDSGWGPPSEDPALAEAWAVAVERFAAVDVELVLEAEGTIPAVGELRHAGDMLALRPLHQYALDCLTRDEDDTRFVPVFVVPCLRSEAIGGSVSTDLGRTPRLPGSLSASTNPSLVLLASGQCNFSAPAEPNLAADRYGVILAHELGHYLGLHHSDIELGAHLEQGAEELLMRSDIATMVEASAAWFSPAQAEVLRRHPVLVF